MTRKAISGSKTFSCNIKANFGAIFRTESVIEAWVARRISSFQKPTSKLTAFKIDRPRLRNKSDFHLCQSKFLEIKKKTSDPPYPPLYGNVYRRGGGG
jgi:hypothetical protein